MMNQANPAGSAAQDKTQGRLPRKRLAAILIAALLLGAVTFAIHWNNARKPDPFPGSLSEFLNDCEHPPFLYYQGEIYLKAIDLTPQYTLSSDWKFAGKVNDSLPFAEPLTADFQTNYEELVGCVLWESASHPQQLYLQAGEEYCEFVDRPLLHSEMYYGRLPQSDND